MGNPKKKFAKIYDKYLDKIYRFVFLKVSSQEIAEDLTSQVFTKGWKRISKIQNPKSPKQSKLATGQAKIKNIPAYLYQIARAEIADHHRERAKFQTVSAEDIPVADANPTPDQKAVLRSDLQTIKKCLSEMKEDHQNLIIWRYLDGMSIKKIAEIMERPRGTVRVMIHRALKELREKMNTY